MIVNARLTDGRTTFQFASKDELSEALTHGPADEAAIQCWAKWRSDEPGWAVVELTYLREDSVAFVVSAADMAESEHDLPALALLNERGQEGIAA